MRGHEQEPFAVLGGGKAGLLVLLHDLVAELLQQGRFSGLEGTTSKSDGDATTTVVKVGLGPNIKTLWAAVWDNFL